MIAADSSSLISYFQGDEGRDVDAIAQALKDETLSLPPVVVTEMLTDEKAGPLLKATLNAAPKLELSDGYWERAGMMRGMLRTMGLKAKIPGVLIAQACIDHDIALITRDTDFKHFADHCGLKLAIIP